MTASRTADPSRNLDELSSGNKGRAKQSEGKETLDTPEADENDSSNIPNLSRECTKLETNPDSPRPTSGVDAPSFEKEAVHLGKASPSTHGLQPEPTESEKQTQSVSKTVMTPHEEAGRNKDSSDKQVNFLGKPQNDRLEVQEGIPEQIAASAEHTNLEKPVSEAVSAKGAKENDKPSGTASSEPRPQSGLSEASTAVVSTDLNRFLSPG